MIFAECVVALVLVAMGSQQPASPQTVQSSESRSFTGILIDTQNTSCGIEVKGVPKGACPAGFRTTSFGLVLQSGQNVKFDETGNARVIEALRKSKKGAKALFDYWRTGKAATTVRARAVGTLTSDTLNLESIQID